MRCCKLDNWNLNDKIRRMNEERPKPGLKGKLLEGEISIQDVDVDVTEGGNSMYLKPKEARVKRIIGEVEDETDTGDLGPAGPGIPGSSHREPLPQERRT